MVAAELEAPIVSRDIPSKFRRFFMEAAPYKVAYGGRGSGKSYQFAIMAVLAMMQRRVRILCVREFQNSLSDSVHATLVEIIEGLGLAAYFTITDNSIKSRTGSECVFKGIRKDPGGIKSFHGADICWVEEAQSVTEKSWDMLLPTIRKEGAEIWVTFNPDAVDDPTYRRWVLSPPPGAIVEKINFTDNRHCSQLLKDQAEHCRRTDYDKFMHVWEGHPKSASDAQIFKGKFISEGFETPSDALLMFGVDWGYDPDPSAGVRCFIKDRKLFIDYEVYRCKVEIIDMPGFLGGLPDIARWPAYADTSANAIISHCQRHGLPKMLPVRKGSGSIEEGISFIKGFDKVVIHPRCKNVYDEFKLYSNKVDGRGSPLPEPEDKHNHAIDALRYALSPHITGKGGMSKARIAGF